MLTNETKIHIPFKGENNNSIKKIIPKIMNEAPIMNKRSWERITFLSFLPFKKYTLRFIHESF